VDGEFASHEAVSLLDEQGCEFGRGLVNYSSEEMIRLKVCVCVWVGACVRAYRNVNVHACASLCAHARMVM